jgi:hypothetical protein
MEPLVNLAKMIGDQITIYATGVGPVSSAKGNAVTSPPASRVDRQHQYPRVATTFGPVTGFLDSVYKRTTIISCPAGHHVSPSSIVLNLDGVVSQNGLSIYI